MTIDAFSFPNITKWGWSSPGNVLKYMTWGWVSDSTQQIENPIDMALDVLVEQFEDSENLKKYLAAIVQPMQDIFTSLKDLDTLRYIHTATGETLNIIGRIVGQENIGGWDDETYRSFIYFRIFINISRGEPETLITVLRTLTNTTKITYLPAYPAGVELYFKEPIDPLPSGLQALIEQVAMGGIRVGLSMGGDNDFAFEGEGGYLTEPDTIGFGETGIAYEDEGGKFVEIL